MTPWNFIRVKLCILMVILLPFDSFNQPDEVKNTILRWGTKMLYKLNQRW
jgi:hypothetical protein